jgi:3-methyladenine DNA glycosylase AlkD
MTSQLLARQINSLCLQLANEANVIKYSRFFKDGLYNGYGLTAPQIYDLVKELSRVKELSLQTVIDAAPDIMKNGKSEEITIIMLLAKGFYKQYTPVTFKSMEGWYHAGINNWAHADTMGMMVLPPFLLKNIVVIKDFKHWLKAENKFQRRSVPVTFIKLLKTHENYPELFAFIEILMTDPEREVHQGTGWFLREAWKRKPEETELFLLKWKDTAPRLIIQYATEKMTPEHKMNFRRKKI